MDNILRALSSVELEEEVESSVSLAGKATKREADITIVCASGNDPTTTKKHTATFRRTKNPWK